MCFFLIGKDQDTEGYQTPFSIKGMVSEQCWHMYPVINTTGKHLGLLTMTFSHEIWAVSKAKWHKEPLGKLLIRCRRYQVILGDCIKAKCEVGVSGSCCWDLVAVLSGRTWRNHLFGFLHCPFDVQTLQGEVCTLFMVVSVDCTVWVEVSSCEPCFYFSFTISKKLAVTLPLPILWWQNHLVLGRECKIWF